MAAELTPIEKIQFRKYVSEHGGMSLQEVDNYIATLAEPELAQLIDGFRQETASKAAGSSAAPAASATPVINIVQGSEKSTMPKCPKCGSTNTIVQKKGLGGHSAAKGCLGTLIAGPFGLLCALCGMNKMQSVCLNCKHTW